jgi:hypothetical protein
MKFTSVGLRVRHHRVSHRDVFSIYSSALCIRYLGGILALPGFWSDAESVTRHDVARKLCSAMVEVLQDLRVDIDQPEDSKDEETLPSDPEGVDFLADAILTGMSDWLNKIDAVKWPHQPWYGKLIDVVGLLRQ